MFGNYQVRDETDRILDALASGLSRRAKDMGQKNDPSSLTPVGPYAHGPGGAFSGHSQDDMVISMMMGPLSGVAGVLPVLDGSDDTGGTFGGDAAEFYTIITGVTKGASEEFANQPTTACADGARSGIMKVCTLPSPMGHYKFAPNAPIDIRRAGLRAEKCDPTTLRLLNAINLGGGALVPSLAEPTPTNALINEFFKRNFEMAMSIRRFFAEELWVATPASNSGTAKRFTGFNLLINENNKVDRDASAICTAANSDVKNFGFNLVNGTGNDIMRYLESMFHYLNWNSVQQGLGQWDGIIAMRPELFDEIVKVVPVRAYQEMLAEMAKFSGGRVTVDGRQALDFRNDMIQGQYLPLRGRRIAVVLDDGIPEDNVTTTGSLTAGRYASGIRFIPLRALGVPVTYLKMFNYNNLQQNTLVRMLNVTETFNTDGGYWSWDRNYKNGCLDWNVEVQPRLTMRTTQLAGIIQNVAYEPLQHTRSYDPDSSYFFDGGRTTGKETPYYTEWSTTTPVNL